MIDEKCGCCGKDLHKINGDEMMRTKKFECDSIDELDKAVQKWLVDSNVWHIENIDFGRAKYKTGTKHSATIKYF